MECSICLGEIIKPTTLDCGHIFCRTCIQLWSQRSLECPYCRQCMSLRAILDNELSEGYNIVQYAGHMHRITVEDVWRSRVKYVCRVVYLWCTVCCYRCHLRRTLPYSVAPIVCIHLAGSPHISRVVRDRTWQSV